MKLFLTIFVFGLSFSLAAKMNGEANAPALFFNSHNLKSFAMNQKEIWKDVVGYEGLYEVSNLGRVKSLQRYVNHRYGGKKIVHEIIMKPGLNVNGYLFVELSSLGVKKILSVHRLKGIAFIPNPENKPMINHRDGIKTNNGYNADGENNLEWVTASENQQHAFDTGLRVSPKYWTNKSGVKHPKSKAVLQFTLSGVLISEYGSAHEASRETKINNSDISKVCRGKRNHAGGFKWKYKI